MGRVASAAWEEPNLAHFLTRLASFSRLIVFDKRGTGMSDPTTSVPTMEERMDDIRAVMDVAGSSRAALFGVSEGGTLSLLFAHRHPERAQALVLYGSWARRLVGPDYPWGLRAAELEGFAAAINRERPYPITAEEVLHGVAAFEAIVRSAAVHRPVKVSQ